LALAAAVESWRGTRPSLRDGGDATVAGRGLGAVMISL